MEKIRISAQIRKFICKYLCKVGKLLKNSKKTWKILARKENAYKNRKI